MAAADFSKLNVILKAALSQHHLSGFEIQETGIPSPPLALFIVMLPKAHLTLHSRMTGSRWVIIPLWLSGSWRYFLYSSSVYSCHLSLMSSASVRSIQFLSFILPIFAWNVLLVSLIFLKIPHVQGQRRSPSKMVGGTKFVLDSNPIPARDTQRAQTNLCTPGPRDPTET